MSKILIVDDEQEFSNALKDRLEANDYTVVVASDGSEGMIKAKEENPDLILMDINMPGINGGDTVLLLQKNSETKHIPIIFLTAIISENEAETLKQIKIEGKGVCTVSKTMDMKNLIKKIDDVLSEET